MLSQKSTMKDKLEKYASAGEDKLWLRKSH